MGCSAIILVAVLVALACGSRKTDGAEAAEKANVPSWRPAPVGWPEIGALDYPASEKWLAAHVAKLAADDMRGRLAGTEDEERAARYLADQLAVLGAEPAASDGSFFQWFDLGSDGQQAARSVNVLAWIPGADSRLGEQYIVVGAHIDHLGTGEAGVIYNGADDNASGVAGLLGIAKAWQDSRLRPRRSVLLIGFGAEEQHLLGSKHFVANPVRPLDQLVAMINLDMLSRPRFHDYEAMALPKAILGIADGPGVGILSSGDDALLEIARCACRLSDLANYAPADFPRLKGVIEDLARGRSDFAPFADSGVPFLFFSTSENDDYHQPTDTLEKIDAGVLRAISSAAWKTVMGIDARDRLDISAAEVGCPIPVGGDDR